VNDRPGQSLLIEKIRKNLLEGEFEEAKKHINLIKQSTNDEDVYEVAEEIASLGFMEEAKDLFLELHKRYPGEGEILFSLAEVTTELGEEEEALLYLEKIDRDDPIYPGALLLLADLYQGMGMDEVRYSNNRLISSSSELACLKYCSDSSNSPKETSDSAILLWIEVPLICVSV